MPNLSKKKFILEVQEYWFLVGIFLLSLNTLIILNNTQPRKLLPAELGAIGINRFDIFTLNVGGLWPVRKKLMNKPSNLINRLNKRKGLFNVL